RAGRGLHRDGLAAESRSGGRGAGKVGREDVLRSHGEVRAEDRRRGVPAHAERLAMLSRNSPIELAKTRLQLKPGCEALEDGVMAPCQQCLRGDAGSTCGT